MDISYILLSLASLAGVVVWDVTKSHPVTCLRARMSNLPWQHLPPKAAPHQLRLRHRPSRVHTVIAVAVKRVCQALEDCLVRGCVVDGANVRQRGRWRCARASLPSVVSSTIVSMMMTTICAILEVPRLPTTHVPVASGRTVAFAGQQWVRCPCVCPASVCTGPYAAFSPPLRPRTACVVTGEAVAASPSLAQNSCSTQRARVPEP